MKAVDFPIGTRICLRLSCHKGTRGDTGTVIYNTCKQGDQVVALELDNGRILAFNVNDLILEVKTEDADKTG